MKPSLRDPSYVSALVYFERVATHLSFTRAAESLGVTASAVSHRIKALEAALGHRLLTRGPQRVQLTEAGEKTHAATSAAFALLEAETARLRGLRSLRVSVGPYLSVTWLMPKLAGFEAQHSNLLVELVHRIGAPDLRDVDLAIWWGRAAEVPEGSERLFLPMMVPVAAPAKAAGLEWPGVLPLLHYRSREGWRIWLRSAGLGEELAMRGEIFEDPNLVLEAAAHGRGAALGFAPFIDSHLASGRLVRLPGQAAPSPEAYWIVPGARRERLAADFAAWLKLLAREVGAE